MQWLRRPMLGGESSLPSRRLRRAALAVLLVAVVGALAPAAGTRAAGQEYGPYGNCYFLLENGQWTQKRCPQSDGSSYFYAPNGGSWTFAMQCSFTSLFRACLLASDWYVETYGDGSTYSENRSRQYFITHTDGTVAEAGYYDAYGVQRVYRGASTTKDSQAMRNRSSLFWYYQGWAVQAVVNSNPAAFAGLITMTRSANDYSNCLHLNDSSTDLDRDGRTGFTELAEFCTAQAYG